MAKVLYKGPEGTVMVPSGLFLDRSDGGHLVVNPPRNVWERSELTAEELVRWSFLVAAAGRAMIDALPQLDGGCVNYFEAGNWALNDAAPPRGPKRALEHRSMHMHIFGRSRGARHPSWRWGEAPRLPLYRDRKPFTAGFRSLDAKECAAVARRLKSLLAARYRQLAPSAKSHEEKIAQAALSSSSKGHPKRISGAPRAASRGAQLVDIAHNSFIYEDCALSLSRRHILSAPLRASKGHPERTR